MTIEHLQHINFVRLKPKPVWRLQPTVSHETRPLPFRDLPPLTPNADSYLLVGAPPTTPPPQRTKATNPKVRAVSRYHPTSFEQPVRSSSDPSDPPAYPPNSFEEQVFVEFAALRIENQTLRSELSEFREDYARSQLPWYKFAYDCHLVNPSPPECPTFFPDLPDCRNRVNLSCGVDNLMMGNDGRFYNTDPLPTPLPDRPPPKQLMQYKKRKGGSRRGSPIPDTETILSTFDQT